MIHQVDKQELKVPAHIDYLGDLRDFVTQIGRKHHFSDKVVNAFKLSVDEAATNIIRHAYRDSEGGLTIRAIVKKNSLTLSIIDQGIFFDPKRVKDPDLNRYVDIGKKGGLGIFIMRKLMDDIDYRKTPEGNELRITKYRDTVDKKRLFKSVGNIPFTIKAQYFFRAIAILTLITALGYLYFFLKTDDELISDFLSASRSTTSTIVNRIGSANAVDFEFVEDIVYPIEEEYTGKVARISVEDSLGIIAYSSNVGEILSEFHRAAGAEGVEPSVYKYALKPGGEVYYEFEAPIVIRETGVVYGKAHIFFSAQGTEAQISAIRLNSLQFALFILGLSYAGVALLIYLVMNPFRKLSEWVKHLGQGDVEDEMDIDASTEIGEIARAFSDIQSKFRDSQKNLADQERLQKEMQVAQEIQQTLLPMEFPELEGYQLAAFYEAAKEVGGDYYDFVEVDKDTLGIVVADVSGKGVPGSLVMTMIRTALRTEARGIKDAAEVLTRVNAFVSNDIKKGMFVTVFYLIVDSRRRRLNYASAGHNPMIIHRGSTGQTYYLNPRGFPIGVQLPDQDSFSKYIESDTIQLAKDDILLLYTDGITEAMNSHRELYGEERLQRALNRFGSFPATKFVERLKDDIYSFTEGAAQYDDITLVAVKEESNREEDELRRAKEVYRLAGEGLSVKDACEQVNMPTSAYYNKYKKFFDDQGVDAFEIDESISVEAKHLSIEEKSKIFDIIQAHPEYGAARIREELNSEKYSYTVLTESKIYEELVRNRLNTKALREAYVSKAKRTRRRIKPPGTPLMTLDGRVVIREPEAPEPTPWATPPPQAIETPGAEPPDVDEGGATALPPASPDSAREEADSSPPAGSVFSEFEADIFLDNPLEDVLAKGPGADHSGPPPNEEGEAEDAGVSGSGFDASPTDMDADSEEGASSMSSFLPSEQDASLLEDFSFDELFAEGATADEDFESEDVTSDTEEAVETAEPEPEAEGVAADENEEVGRTEDEPAVAEERELERGELSAEESETSFTVASLEELLEDSRFSESDEEDDFAASAEGAASEPDEPSVGEEGETVSFSDLIQAIDEEIVYVTEPPLEQSLKSAEQAPLPEMAAESRQTSVAEDPESAVGLASENGSANGQSPGEGAAPAERNRETILVDGIKYYKNNEYDKAIAEFKKVLSIYPDYKEAHSILGNAYFRNKMYNEAAVEYQKVKEIDPEDITAYENMGVIYANRGEYREAVGEWKKVIELSPTRADIEDKIRRALRLI